MADVSKIQLPSGDTYDLVDKKSGYKVVSINRKVDSGVNIADITIGDTTTQLYAPQGGGSGTITQVKTTAGAHTAIDVSSGAATFNVPTNTSHLTNDSGFVTASEVEDGYLPLTGGTVTGSVIFEDTITLNNKVVGNGRIFYGTCSTNAAFSTKSVDCPDYDAVSVGDLIFVKFTKTNTASPSTLSLKVNNTDAYNIEYMTKNGSIAPLSSTGYLNTAGIYTFVFDGSYWILTCVDTDHTYSGGSLSWLEAGTSTNDYLWQPKILHDYIASVVPTVPTNVSAFTNDAGYTTNTGTVTSVGISNATNGGLSISGSPVTNSGTITIGHSNVLSSAQTTQAVYPIKIDKNGHISAYGSAVTIPTVPTNVSAFTNDAGYVTTDTKNTAGSTNSSNKIFLIGATSQATNPQTYSNSNLYFNNGLYSHAQNHSSGQYIDSFLDQSSGSILLSVYDDNYTDASSINIYSNYIQATSTELRLSLDSTSDATLISDIASLGWTSDVIV